MHIERQIIQYGGLEIPSTIIAPSNPSGAAVLVHGYGGCKEELMGLALRVAELGIISCVIDLRGHGENLLNLDHGVFSDVEATIKYCRRYGKVAAIGHSSGGRLSLLSSADFAIGISPTLNKEFSETTQKVLKDLRNYRVREASQNVIFDILQKLPVWHPNKSRQTSVIFGSRDIPEIVQACKELVSTDTTLDFIAGALHSDIFLLEKTIESVTNQLTKWFSLDKDNTLLTLKSSRFSYLLPGNAFEEKTLLPSGLNQKKTSTLKELPKRKKDYPRLLRLGSLAAILGICALTGIGFVSPSFASKVRNVSYSISSNISDFFGLQRNLDEYKIVINKEVTDNSITVKLNEVILNGNGLTVSYNVSPNIYLEENKNLSWPGFNSISVNGKEVNGSGGVSKNVDNKSIQSVMTYDLGKIDLSGDLDIKILSSAISLKDKEKKASWNFEFKTNGNQLIN